MVIGALFQLGRIRFQANLSVRENQSEGKIKSKPWRKQNQSGENSSLPLPRPYKKNKPIQGIAFLSNKPKENVKPVLLYIW